MVVAGAAEAGSGCGVGVVKSDGGVKSPSVNGVKEHGRSVWAIFLGLGVG